MKANQHLVLLGFLSLKGLFCIDRPGLPDSAQNLRQQMRSHSEVVGAILLLYHHYYHHHSAATVGLWIIGDIWRRRLFGHVKKNPPPVQVSYRLRALTRQKGSFGAFSFTS